MDCDSLGKLPMRKNVIQYKRNDGIDLLRGICIISVILLHCKGNIPFDHNIIPQWLFNIIFGSGYYGVIIFFVISGFLITSHCLQRWGSTQHVHVRAFYRMRFARIMPCLLLLLTVLSVLDLLHINGFIIHTTTLPKALFSALTFHINYLQAKTGYLPGNWDVLWSLSVEEVFYLFFPIICLLCVKPRYFITSYFTLCENLFTSRNVARLFIYIRYGWYCHSVSCCTVFTSKKNKSEIIFDTFLSWFISFFTDIYF